MSQRKSTASRRLYARLPGRVLALAFALDVSVALAGPPELVVDEIQRVEEGLTFSFSLPDGLPEDLSEQLDSGERVIVSYKIEVFRDRRFWFNAGLGELDVELTAHFDPLTKRYTLERFFGKEADGGRDVGERAAALSWLSSQQEVLVPAVAAKLKKKGVRYRVRAVLDRRLVLFFIPTTVKSSWARGFLPGSELVSDAADSEAQGAEDKEERGNEASPAVAPLGNAQP